MININNKTLSGIYKNGNEVVKILKNELIVYQIPNETIVDPYTSPGVYYHKTTGGCVTEKTRMGNSYDGVVVSDGTHVLRIGKHDYDKNGQIVTDSSILDNKVRFGLYNLDITSYDITSCHKNHPEEAILDFDGYNNTLKLHQTSVDQLQDRFHIVGCPLADLALSMNGYIPATGEWHMIFNHLDEINAKLQQIGGDIILKKDFRYSSTTIDDNYSMWVFYQSDPSDMRQQYGLDYFSRENKTFYRPVYQVPRD